MVRKFHIRIFHIQDNLLEHVKTLCSVLLLISSFTPSSESYARVFPHVPATCAFILSNVACGGLKFSPQLKAHISITLLKMCSLH